MLKNKKIYSNIVAIAREDAREYRIVNGMNSDILSNRWYYRLCQWAKIISFVVLLAMGVFFALGALNELSGLGSYNAPAAEKEAAIADLIQSIRIVGLSLLFILAGFVLSLIKKGGNPIPLINIIGAVLIVAFCCVLSVHLFFAAKNSANYYDGGLSRFIWRFVVPSVVVSVSALAQSILGAFDKKSEKAMYNAVLEEVYDKFIESRETESYTEEEWEEFVASYRRESTAQ